jgi:hypothetical protein
LAYQLIDSTAPIYIIRSVEGVGECNKVNLGRTDGRSTRLHKLIGRVGLPFGSVALALLALATYPVTHLWSNIHVARNAIDRPLVCAHIQRGLGPASHSRFTKRSFFRHARCTSVEVHHPTFFNRAYRRYYSARVMPNKRGIAPPHGNITPPALASPFAFSLSLAQLVEHHGRERLKFIGNKCPK